MKKGVDMDHEMPLADMKENWVQGSSAWFEYHCFEDPVSSDAQVWYRSHQKVKVLFRNCQDEVINGVDGCSATERFDAGAPATYRVAFLDGLEWDVFEDELLVDESFFYRPAPPVKPMS